MQEIIELMIHADQLISDIVSRYGTLTYLILFAIIFIETGLVVVTFFPGDGLLFSAGILAASQDLDLTSLLILLSLATILGHISNFFIGRFLGERFFRKQDEKRYYYLTKAKNYYDKWGNISIIASRFFPFMRSFVPFVAGISKMNLVQFHWCNIVGGVGWICTYILLGYFFGEIPLVKDNFGYVFSIIIITLLIYLLIVTAKMTIRRVREKK